MISIVSLDLINKILVMEIGNNLFHISAFKEVGVFTYHFFNGDQLQKSSSLYPSKEDDENFESLSSNKYVNSSIPHREPVCIAGADKDDYDSSPFEISLMSLISGPTHMQIDPQNVSLKFDYAINSSYNAENSSSR